MDDTINSGSHSEKPVHLLESISNPLIALDNGWNITYANKKAKEVIGNSEEPIIGKTFWNLNPDLKEESFYKACHNSLSRQAHAKVVFYYSKLNKWYEHHIYPFENGLSIYFFDITDRKREEEDLKITKDRLIKAEEIGNLGYWELTQEKDKLWGSEQTLKIFGFSSTADHIPISKVEPLIEDLEKLREANSALIMQGKKYDIRLTIHPADNSPERIISVVADIEKGHEGGNTKIVGVVKDITEIIKSEQRLAESYKRTASILESIDMAFFYVDSDWKIKSWNKEAEKNFANEKPFNNDVDLWEVLSQTDGDLKKELKEAVQDRKSCQFEDYFPGRHLWIRFRCFPFEEGLSIFLLDITERKRREHLDLLEKDALDFYTNKNVNLKKLITFLLDGLRKIHPEMLCSVLRYKDNHLYNWSSPHLPEEYNDEVEGLEIGLGKGSCGSSAFLRENVAVTDIRNNSLWKDYKEIIKEFPMRSCTSYPMIDSRQKLLGTFAVYFNSLRPLTASEEQSVDRVRKILVNVIEKKTVEDEAKEYKDQLELIFNTSREIIFLVSVEENEKFRMTRVNDPYLTAAGLSRSEVEGKLLEEIITEPLLSDIKSKYKEAISTRKTISWEQVSQYPNETRTSDVYLSPIMNKENECKQLIGYVHETTQQKKAEEDLRKANDELKSANENLIRKNTILQEIAWMTAHKVRTPVARILGLANFFINYATDPKEKRDLIKYMLTSVEELDEMIKEIVERTAKAK